MKGSLFAGLPPELPEELIETLTAGKGARIERIVSRGHVSPEGFWYDQPQSEFVLLVAGGARLRIEGEQGVIALEPGDYLQLEAHQRHRVEWTDPSCDTIWLAVHS